jgi:D-sedoheptulose 7-phosphate isomerase
MYVWRFNGREEKTMTNHYAQLFDRYPLLEPCREAVKQAFETLACTFKNGGKLLICGNGGSAADADHIVGELMKGFYLKRRLNAETMEKLGEMGKNLQGALPAISLTQHTALATAFANDVEPAFIFAQQVYGYGRPGDALLCLSTSGNAGNVLNAAKTAQALGLAVIGMTGESGGKLPPLCRVCINVPANSPAHVQELHLPVYHTLCAMLEEEFFG